MPQSLFNKVAGPWNTPAQVFSCEFCKIVESTFFTEHLRATPTEFLMDRIYLVEVDF